MASVAVLKFVRKMYSYHASEVRVSSMLKLVMKLVMEDKRKS